MALNDYIKNLRPLPVSNQNEDRGAYGDALSEYLVKRRDKAGDFHKKLRGRRTSEVALDVVDKSAGNVPTSDIGIPSGKGNDFQAQFGRQLDTIGQQGQIALEASTERARFQKLEALKKQASTPITGIKFAPLVPGASKDNPGAKAVSLAMQTYQNKTPYVWGGNSLTKGVDCSGLVQQVYSQLGIKLPRTTYEQAKNGKQVSMGQLLPGDLIFYNTGRNDPNGIGANSHVAIYTGNGQVVHAVNSREGVKHTNINYVGSPSVALRPW